MTSKPGINVSSRARRALRDVSRFKFTSADILDTSNPDQPDEEYGVQIGIYENPPGIEPSRIVVTARGLGCIGSGQTRWIRYDDIETIEGPQEKLVDGEIVVILRSGIRMRIPIAGGDGRFRDVFSFLRFLDRVLEDLRRSGSN